MTEGWFNVPAALVAKWMRDAQVDPAIKPVRVIYATRATPDEMAALKAERRAKERKHSARVVKWGFPSADLPRRRTGR